MSRKGRERRTLEVRAVGKRYRTRGGNWFLPCETDAGMAAFWGSAKNPDNVHFIETQRPPFVVTCDCISSNWSDHDLWVPDSSTVEILPSRESPSSGWEPTDSRRQISRSPDRRKADTRDAESWMDAMELVAPSLRRLLNQLFRRQAPVPMVGFELAGKTGVVLAEAELAWPERNVAVLLPEQWDSIPTFENAGWQVFFDETEDRIDALATSLDS